MKHLLILALGLALLMSCEQDSGSFEVGNSGTLSGSYATLLTVSNYLYAINEEELTTFDITDTNDPQEVDKQDVGFEIENIYHNNGVLFIGSSTTLHIFSIGADGIPKRENQTEYNFDNNEEWQPCDPVIANDNYAYVTLSTSQEFDGPCGGTRVWINELRIYDVADLSSPELLSITEMGFPKGLALDGNHLFVCEGNTGLKLFDVSDPEVPELMWEDTGFESYDLILKDGLMMVVGPDAIRQYDYSDINDIVYLSSLDL